MSARLQQVKKKSSPIHIQLISADKNTEISKKPQLDNQTINIKKTKTQPNKALPLKKSNTNKINNDDIIEKIIASNLDIDKDNKKQSEIYNKDIKNDEIIKNLIEKAESFAMSENNLRQQNPSQNRAINSNVDEENENEGANEDNTNNENNKNYENNEELTGFESLYRTQNNQKSININQEKMDKSFTETPVFDDILYVSEMQAEQHLIEPPPPQLPIEIIKKYPQQPWQVVVTLYVDKHGNVLNQPKPFIKPLQSSGNQLIDENALQYAISLRFQPFIKNDKAVVAEVELAVRY